MKQPKYKREESTVNGDGINYKNAPMLYLMRRTWNSQPLHVKETWASWSRCALRSVKNKNCIYFQTDEATRQKKYSVW